MSVNFHLLRSAGSLQDLRSRSRSLHRMPFFQNFHSWSLIVDHLYLRIAMMAQAVIPCNLLLACRVEVVDDPTVPLRAEMRCGSYGIS